MGTPLPRVLAKVWIDQDLGIARFQRAAYSPQALDERTPLLERAKFLAIFSSNLDEFFMKRMSVLRCGKTGDEQCPCFAEVLRQADSALKANMPADCYRDLIVPQLASYGILLRNWDDLTSAQQQEAGLYFESSLSPALTPLVIDPAHPFPFLSNLSTSLTFLLRDAQTGESIYARIKVPGVLKQWIPLSGGPCAGRIASSSLSTKSFAATRTASMAE